VLVGVVNLNVGDIKLDIPRNLQDGMGYLRLELLHIGLELIGFGRGGRGGRGGGHEGDENLLQDKRHVVQPIPGDATKLQGRVGIGSLDGITVGLYEVDSLGGGRNCRDKRGRALNGLLNDACRLLDGLEYCGEGLGGGSGGISGRGGRSSLHEGKGKVAGRRGGGGVSDERGEEERREEVIFVSKILTSSPSAVGSAGGAAAAAASSAALAAISSSRFFIASTSSTCSWEGKGGEVGEGEGEGEEPGDVEEGDDRTLSARECLVGPLQYSPPLLRC
jgi:hypothetical protein